MSCVHFTTAAQRSQVERSRSIAAAPVLLTAEQIAAQHPAPPVTDGKLHRLRLLATDPAPKIREAAAASPHLPADAAALLACDADSRVRACLARNDRAPVDLLTNLATDEDATVRAWIAVNRATPPEVVAALRDDANDRVRSLAEWALADRAGREARLSARGAR